MGKTLTQENLHPGPVRGSRDLALYQRSWCDSSRIDDTVRGAERVDSENKGIGAEAPTIPLLSRVRAPLRLETGAERACLKVAGHPQTWSRRLPCASSQWGNPSLSELWEARSKTNPSCLKEKMCSLPPRLLPVGSSLHRHWQEGEEKEEEEGGGISSNRLGCQSSCSTIPLLQGCSRQFSSATCPENPSA